MNKRTTEEEFVREATREWVGTDVRFEKIPWALFSTQIISARQREQLRFFDSPGPATRTNMYIGGMLPNPQAFLIQSIKIFGLGSAMAFALFHLRIGAKTYADRPVWLAGPRPGFTVLPGIMIPPLLNFHASIEWEGPADLGRGFSGRQIDSRPVQVAFVGLILRPLQ